MFVGEIGLPRADFLTVDMWELRAIVRGFTRRHRDILEMLRNLGYWQLASAGGSKFTNSCTITDLFRFPWDTDTGIQPLSDEEIARMQDIMRKENESAPK